MLFKEIIGVYCENHMEHINTLFGKNAESFYFLPRMLSSYILLLICVVLLNSVHWHPRVEVVSNSSTVTLRVVGGDGQGSLKFETVKYDRESQGTRTRERPRWLGPAVYAKADPSSHQSGRPTKIKP
jgi:hypothetical protein